MTGFADLQKLSCSTSGLNLQPRPLLWGGLLINTEHNLHGSPEFEKTKPSNPTGLN